MSMLDALPFRQKKTVSLRNTRGRRRMGEADDWGSLSEGLSHGSRGLGLHPADSPNQASEGQGCGAVQHRAAIAVPRGPTMHPTVLRGLYSGRD